MKTSIIEAWQRLIDILFLAARESIDDELDSGIYRRIDTDSIKKNVDHINQLTNLSERLDDFEKDIIDYVEFSSYAIFIKEIESDIDAFRNVLEVIFESGDADSIKENIDSIVSAIFDNKSLSTPILKEK